MYTGRGVLNLNMVQCMKIQSLVIPASEECYSQMCAYINFHEIADDFPKCSRSSKTDQRTYNFKSASRRLIHDIYFVIYSINQ